MRGLLKILDRCEQSVNFDWVVTGYSVLEKPLGALVGDGLLPGELILRW